MAGLANAAGEVERTTHAAGIRGAVAGLDGGRAVVGRVARREGVWRRRARVGKSRRPIGPIALTGQSRRARAGDAKGRQASDGNEAHAPLNARHDPVANTLHSGAWIESGCSRPGRVCPGSTQTCATSLWRLAFVGGWTAARPVRCSEPRGRGRNGRADPDCCDYGSRRTSTVASPQ
jgi:hypothetical protein